MNILFLSCGSRNKLIQYFKKEIAGQGLIIAADCSRLAPALYEADKHFIIPRFDDQNYIKSVLSICKDYNVKALISLIDPELNIISKHKEKFFDIGTLPIVSDINAVAMCYDKYLTYNFLKTNGFNAIKSYLSKESFYDDFYNNKIQFPVFIKPIKGSASININKVNNEKELDTIFSRFEDLMIQEYIDGIEYGIDAYVDLVSKETIAIFIKEKLKMRAGETDKAVSIKDEKILEIIKQFLKVSGLIGPIDIDLFKKDNDYYISEINPRFGGGYPLAYECGINFPKMIINNIKGISNEVDIANYEQGVYMFKYFDLKVIKNI